MSRRVRGLAPISVFYSRLARAFGWSLALVGTTLAVGTVGYQLSFPGITWVDAFHQAALLLAGMGPVLPEEPDKLGNVAKLFDSAYALVCAIVLFGATGILFSPIIHRLLHRFHLEDTGG
jgi:hypothetical protein